jgi:hypothetical protein
MLREQNAPVHRLETVAGIRDGPAYNDAQRILKIRFAQLFLYADLRLRGHSGFRHKTLTIR